MSVTQGSRDHLSCRAPCFPRATLGGPQVACSEPRGTWKGPAPSSCLSFLPTISEELGWKNTGHSPECVLSSHGDTWMEAGGPGSEVPAGVVWLLFATSSQVFPLITFHRGPLCWAPPPPGGSGGCSGGREGRREEGVGEEEGASGQGPQGSEGRARRVWRGRGRGVVVTQSWVGLQQTFSFLCSLTHSGGPLLQCDAGG